MDGKGPEEIRPHDEGDRHRQPTDADSAARVPVQLPDGRPALAPANWTLTGVIRGRRKAMVTKTIHSRPPSPLRA
ncbi:hypothetical protein RHCRD62_50248 [Rhodococcus sp. RD6.2]|nr:hypothetical protein RHCRD62_50248 [Rhodococcus sp. RD6.2]